MSLLSKLRGDKSIPVALKPEFRRTLSGKRVSNATPPPDGWGIVPGYKPKAAVPVVEDTSRRTRRARERFTATQRRKQRAVMTRARRVETAKRWNDPEYRAKVDASALDTYHRLIAVGTAPKRAAMLAKRSVG